nr:hypothetical protein [Tanacetum cinerariifolium]
MALTFADTHNIIAYLTKSDASEGFNQIIDFLNASLIEYALTVNPNIYVSCIKQFWTSVSMKKVNDVTRLQALVDKKRVIITEATIRDAFRLNDGEGIDCLPNEEIFTKLARMGYARAQQVDESVADLNDDDVHVAGVADEGDADGRMIVDMDADVDVTLKDIAKDVSVDAEIEESADVIDHVQRKEKEDNAMKRYQALKRKPQTEAQARKNMMIYLRNVARFKMDYFKGMTYDDIRPIFEKKFNSNVAFLQKTKEQMEEEDSRALKRISESQEDKAAKKQKLDEEVQELRKHLQIVLDDEDDVHTEATPLARKVPVVDYEIYTENNKPYYKIIRADGSLQLFLSFLSY